MSTPTSSRSTKALSKASQKAKAKLEAAATPAVLESQRLYARFLTGWASDALRLRARGLDTPSARQGTRLAISPGNHPHRTPTPAFLALYHAQTPRWIPPASAKAA